MLKTLANWLRRCTAAPVTAHEPATTSTLIESNEAAPTQVALYDENLLERSRTQWQFGDWHSLAQLQREALQHHPDRAKLALLAAAGHQQLGYVQIAGQLVRQARDWGCDKKLIAQILIAGVHNTLGRATASIGKETAALQHFKRAISLGTPGSDTPLLVKARAKEQLQQLSPIPALSPLRNSNSAIAPKQKTEYVSIPTKETLKLDDCRKLPQHQPSTELGIGGRKAIEKEIIYGEKKFNFFFRPESTGDNGVIKQIFEEKQYEFGWLPQGKKLYQLYEGLTNSGKTPSIIDAGANIGASSTWFLLKFPKSSIIAIEPDAENCELLKNNNAGKNVQIFQGGLANGRRTLFINDPGHSDWGFRVEESGSKKVDCIGPEEVLNHCASNETPPLILKIDIEGGEAMVFEGECRWLESIPLVIIELHDWMLPGQNTSANFLRAIANHDFDLITRGENIFCFNRKITN